MTLSDLHATLQALARTYQVPGAQVGLLVDGKRIVACTGRRSIPDDEPVTPDTSFHAGSLTKAVTALTVLGAARRGDLDLDAPCSDQAAGLWSETPRALLTQTSGRPNVLPDRDETLVDFVARTAAMPLVHQPGRFSYCNAGWSVLDLLLQRRTGRGFEEAATELLGPGTTFGRPADAAAGHAVAPGGEPQEVQDEYADAASAAGARWWATADQLLDFAELQLGALNDVVHPDDVATLRRPTAVLPGSTVFDAWGCGWAVWDRGPHQAFGWAGYTGGHRAFLRCFPDQHAAVVVLTNSAGPLFGPPGGSALFDAMLPWTLEGLGVPALAPPSYPTRGAPAPELAGQFGPLLLEAQGPDVLLLHAAAFGAGHPVRYERRGGDTFDVAGNPPGGTALAIDNDLLYLGPFAMPRI